MDVVEQMKIKKLIRNIVNRSFLRKPLNAFEKIKFSNDFNTFSKLSTSTTRRFDVKWENRYPIMNEATEGHSFDRHYVYHTAWAARKLKEISPSFHIDISSSLYFNAITSAFIPIKFYDFRPANIRLNNFSSEKANITHLQFPDNSVESISCMHVVEHIGLGRYGDDLNPDGDLSAMFELSRVVASGGSILFVVPIGKPLLQFNAQRVYSFRQIMNQFIGFSLVEFSLIPDSKKVGIIINALEEQANEQDFGCGCFWFKKN